MTKSSSTTSGIYINIYIVNFMMWGRSEMVVCSLANLDLGFLLKFWIQFLIQLK